MSYLDKAGLEVFWKVWKEKLKLKQNKIAGDSSVAALNSGITSSLVNKLNGVEWYAKKNVQSDWNATSGDAFIKNKPVINDGWVNIKVKGNSQGFFHANATSDLNVNLTKELLGVSTALQFRGVTTTDLYTGATTNPIKLSDGSSFTCSKGDVVITQYKEFLFDGTSWYELGDEKSYASKSVQIIAGTGLTGGGGINSNVKLRHKFFKDSSSAEDLGFVKISKGDTGHIEKYASVTKSDITALGIPANNTNQKISATNYDWTTTTYTNNATISIQAASGSRTTVTADTANNKITLNTPTINAVTTTSNGYMLATDKTKLDGVANNATRVLVDATPTANSTNAVKTSAVANLLDTKLNTSSTISEATINSILNS